MASSLNDHIHVWRLVPEKANYEPFSGEGAARYGGRWNCKGIPILYTSSSISLAMLEILVNLRGLRSNPTYLAYPLEIPSNLSQALSIDSLSGNWNKPSSRSILQEIGAEWAKSNASLALKVPSVVNPYEFNYLINPSHPHFGKLNFPAKKHAKVVQLDPRLVLDASSESIYGG